MSNIEKKAGVVGLGVLSAVALLGCLAAGLRMVSILFPGSGLDHSSWGTWLAVMALPEAVFVAATVLLWRKKGRSRRECWPWGWLSRCTLACTLRCGNKKKEAANAGHNV